MNEQNIKLGQNSQCFAELVHSFGSHVQNDRVGDLFSNQAELRSTRAVCGGFAPDLSRPTQQSHVDQLEAFYASCNYIHKPSGYRHPPALLSRPSAQRSVIGTVSSGFSNHKVHELAVAARVRKDKEQSMLQQYTRHHNRTTTAFGTSFFAQPFYNRMY